MQTLFAILVGLFGLSVLVAIAWLFSADKGRAAWKLVATGVALQIDFAALVLRSTASWTRTRWRPTTADHTRPVRLADTPGLA